MYARADVTGVATFKWFISLENLSVPILNLTLDIKKKMLGMSFTEA
jgi:hypothetical protein